MKRLMIVVAAALTGGFALADAQVYEMQLTMKTTVTRLFPWKTSKRRSMALILDRDRL